MQLPFFYIDSSIIAESILTLEEENSKHIVQVLRMKAGENIHLTDGKGNRFTARIISDHKKHCQVQVTAKELIEKTPALVTIAISLLKSSSRFEWFLEKATEIGVEKIVLLDCKRTEKQKFRMERLQAVCVAAMLQSEQCWLPEIIPPIKFEKIVDWQESRGSYMIAHCEEGVKTKINEINFAMGSPRFIAIGPEGDFTNEEISFAIGNGFIGVSLGDTRLRTETAGIVAATLLKFN